jgi:hypothetical protein
MVPAPGPTIGPTSFTFAGIDWGKVGAGIAVAIAGAILTYLSQLIPTLNFGPAWTPVVMTVWTSLAVIARKWVSDNA